MEAFAASVKASGKTKDEELSLKILENTTRFDGERLKSECCGKTVMKTIPRTIIQH